MMDWVGSQPECGSESSVFFRFDGGSIWCLYWVLNDESF
jgi:hypothetical protein